MFDTLKIYKHQLEEIVLSGEVLLSNQKPSEWAEENVIMREPFPGPLRYTKTPYTREIIDCLDPSHPAKWIACKKGAQVGFSATVILPACGWIIKCSPGNTYFTVGSPDLIEKATVKLDIVISDSGIRDYIKPQALRKRNTKTGDTNSKKEFTGGYIYITGVNNHKAIRDVSLKYGFFDDWESVKKSSKESGSTRKLVEQRFAAYNDRHKIFYISTPEAEEGSNIDAAYQLGDKRKYFVPCPCCKEMITLEWETESKIDANQKAGIIWKLTEDGKVIQDSVGYICQECGEFFDDKNKHELLNAGEWKATCEPSKEGYYSYHLSALYAPLGMFDWYRYACDYHEANPPGQPRKEELHKTFMNVCLGECYTPSNESPSASDLQNNVQNYNIGVVPDKLSEEHGNGRIILLTVAFDLNGVPDDARIDYEVLAHAENEATYSVTHGSIGTFIPNQTQKEKDKDDRSKWTYELNKSNSVWPEVDKVINTIFPRESGKPLKISLAGIDTGHYNNYAYAYIDSRGPFVVALKGDKENKYIPFGVDVPNIKPGREHSKLYIVQVGQLKDKVAALMKMKHNKHELQQPGFMNYPIPSGGLYLGPNYFSHYEAEKKIIEKKEDETIRSIWKKKVSNAQNHMWDCRIYNLALRDVLVNIVGKETKNPKFTWQDYVNALLGRK